jgi:hypothetical protein
MFDVNNHPDPLGSSGGGGSPMGDGFVIEVTPEVVPVRLIVNSPIQVLVMNWPGMPPPIPGLKGPGFSPPLPSMKRTPSPLGESAGLGLGDMGLGNIVKLGSIAGVAAAGVGLVASGFNELKSTVLDPIIGAAKGGLNEGFAKGAGLGAMAKGFMLFGTVIGIQVLPYVLKLGAAAMTAAEMIDRFSEGPLGKVLTTLPIDALGGAMGNKDGGWLSTLSMAGEKFTKPLDRLTGSAGLLGGLGVLGLSNQRKAAFGSDQLDSGTIGKSEKKNLKELMDAFKLSLGSQAGFVGVADIRGQAQMAALRDPFEAKVMDIILQKLPEIEKRLGLVADNTKPPGQR